MPKRFLHVLVVCVCAFTMLGAGNADHRYEKLGHALVCQCGCGQILAECNHVGCPVSPVMLDELHKQIATGLPDTGVLNFFIGKYGPIALASPSRGGFDTVAWVVPFAILLLGILLVTYLLKRRRPQFLPAAPPAPISDELREKIRRDTNYGE